MTRHAQWGIRAALALVYVWFGALKLLGLSPATGLVRDLFDKTVPVLDFPTFMALFAAFEVAIGIAFLVPRLTRVAFGATCLHLISTALPLVLLPGHAWSGVLIPTMEGQYILKNVLILASAYALLAQRSRSAA